MLIMITKWRRLRSQIVYCMCLTISLFLLSQVERFGKPTWRRLVKAVEDHVGGSNSALAQKIATEHPGAPGNHAH